MSEPATETFEKLTKFMKLTPEQRDESLWFRDNAIKGELAEQSEKVEILVKSNGLLQKSNSRLQKAIYVGSGFMIAVKVYFDYFHKP